MNRIAVLSSTLLALLAACVTDDASEPPSGASSSAPAAVESALDLEVAADGSLRGELIVDDEAIVIESRTGAKTLVRVAAASGTLYAELSTDVETAAQHGRFGELHYGRFEDRERAADPETWRPLLEGRVGRVLDAVAVAARAAAAEQLAHPAQLAALADLSTSLRAMAGEPTSASTELACSGAIYHDHWTVPAHMVGGDRCHQTHLVELTGESCNTQTKCVEFYNGHGERYWGHCGTNPQFSAAYTDSFPTYFTGGLWTRTWSSSSGEQWIWRNGRCGVETLHQVWNGFYWELYNDLKAAFGRDGGSLQMHWWDAGMREGRISSPSFWAPYYLARYADLRNAYGSDHAAAARHYMNHGIREGRQAIPTFDPRYYLAIYPDLRNTYGSANYGAAVSHYINNGVTEGRRGSAEFDPRWYLANHWDVAQAYGQTNYRGALVHYLLHGRNEGRRGAP